MTNRLCGTCRFFEANALQTHGRCRNAAYPRRDELAMLRRTELGCREGWHKDYWEVSPDADKAEAQLSSPEVAPGEVTSLPVGVGFLPLVEADFDPAVGAPPNAEPPSYLNAGQDTVLAYDPRQGSHPELGENGVPLPRARRTSVAEAHKRALQRRQSERANQPQRMTAPLTSPPRVPPPPVAPAAPGAAERAARADDVAQPEGPASSSRPTVPVAPPTPVAPMARTLPPSEIPSDQVVSAGNADTARVHEVQVFTPAADPARVDHPVAAPPPLPPLGVPEALAERHAAVTERVSFHQTAAPTEPAGVVVPAPPASEPRYWDQPAPANRFTRMRPPAEEPEVARTETSRTARQVGRPRPEPAAEQSRPARTIRALGASQAGEAQPADEPAPRVELAVTAPVPRPEVPPRQVDQTLIRQLEVDWHEKMLAETTGKRCGSCRYLQPSESGRGTCACPFSPVYRQPVPAQELACLNPLGYWWAASDEGWLEKTEARRPRRATPLLDALERELAAARSVTQVTERRRSAR